MGTACVSGVSSETASWGCGATAYVLAIRYGSCRFIDGCHGIGNDGGVVASAARGAAALVIVEDET